MDRKSNYWQGKLAALLHDTPDKAADILTHEQRAARFRSLFRDVTTFQKTADFDAAAADRLPFPKAAALMQTLTGIESIPHPLGGASLPIAGFKSPAEAEGISAESMPFLLDDNDPRAAFICAWRFWRNWASSKDSRFAVLPADTRIPDHTIWNHLSVTTAFEGSLPGKTDYSTEEAPRLLLFSLGPVQDFIAAARSTRDLWSGSYLLSYLISKILGDIALEFGPDHVLFPNLLDQPLIDLRLRDEVFSKHRFAERSVWEGFGYTDTDDKLPRLLTPSLPNRFMALLPAKDHEGNPIEEWILSRVEDLKDELNDIGSSVVKHLDEAGVDGVANFDAGRFSEQTKRLLELHWQTLPIPQNPADLDEWMKALPEDSGEYSPRKAFEAVRAMTKVEACKPQYNLRTTSNWAGLNALLSFLHDGAKASRVFDAWRGGRWESGTGFNKDALNGREEAVLRMGDSDEALKSFCSSLEMSKGTLKRNELLGASTLIKRFWWQTWLIKEKILGIGAKRMREANPMPNTRSIAAGRPFDFDDEQDEPTGQDEKYFAVLALDGDEMGKWISGSKAPTNEHCLSPEAKAFYQKHAPDFLNAPRALNPSWHLQFSEALGNFSFHAARRIVEAFDGRLIYAGGDDVLAMLPAKDAIPCARALRAAFRGEKSLDSLLGVLEGTGKDRKSDRKTKLFSAKDEGYLRLDPGASKDHGPDARLLSDPVSFPALVPGPEADVSVGIAIAHFKSPLQDVVRAAQAAEKRAKRSPKEGGLDRAAVAVTLFKRSGEITEWGCKWSSDKPDSASFKPDSASFKLLTMLIEHLKPKGALNARFPNKFETLLTAYLPTSDQLQMADGFEETFDKVLTLELDHCLTRNEGGRLTPEERDLFQAAWRETEGRPFVHRLQSLINLLRVAAWMRRGEKAPKELQPS